MVRVTVNGRDEEIPDGLSIADYLHRRQAIRGSLVVELNGAVLDRSTWAVQILHGGDRLEVVRFVQGG